MKTRIWDNIEKVIETLKDGQLHEVNHFSTRIGLSPVMARIAVNKRLREKGSVLRLELLESPTARIDQFIVSTHFIKG